METQSNDVSSKVETFRVKMDRMAARDIPGLLILYYNLYLINWDELSSPLTEPQKKKKKEN